MSSPLSLATANSLNRRPVKSENSQSEPKNHRAINRVRLDRPEQTTRSHIKREQEGSQHHGGERTQRTPHQTEAGRAVQRPVKQDHQSSSRVDSDPRINSYVKKIQERFPGKPNIHNDFVMIINAHRSAEDAMPYVSNLLRGAPELVRDYTNMVNVLNAQWFRDRHRPTAHPQSTSQQHHSPRRPIHVPHMVDSSSDDDHTTDEDDTGDSDSDVQDDEDSNAHPRGLGGPNHSGGIQDAQASADIEKLMALPEIYFPPEKRKQTPRAMACKLLEHQKIGLTWLVQREQDSHKKGGLLADTMGLGKTVQAISLILAHPSRDPACKTTLVITPVALLKQWEREIQTKVKAPYKLKTLIFHGPVKRGMTVSKLLSYDVVLTTYGKVVSEYKVSVQRRSKKRPILLADDARFHRIILDEAHNIRNRRSERSLAVCMLKATYRLCMTGTPFMNHTSEIFALIRFLRIPPYNSWERFNQHIARPLNRWDDDERSAGMVKLQALFRSITLRRAKSSALDGKKIIQLPSLSVEKSGVEFDEDQRAFYDALENKQRLEFNKYLRIGINSSNYAHILVLLLRLRQACCHPHLIKNYCIPDGTQLSPEQMTGLALKLNERVVERIKLQERFQCPLCGTEVDNPIINYPCGHHLCDGCFTTMMEIKHLTANANMEDAPESPCPQDHCSAKIEPDRILCYNFFREAHMGNGSESEASEDEDDDPDEDDANAQGNLKGFVVSDEHDGEGDEESAEEGEENQSPSTPSTSPPSRRKAANAAEPFSSPSTSRRQDTSDLEPAEEADNSDDSDDSLPSLEQIRQRIFGSRLLAKGRSSPTKKGSTPLKSERGIETDQTTTPAKGKRKRSADDEANMSRKRVKTESASTPKRGKRGKKAGRGAIKSLAALKKEASNSVVAKAKYLKHLRKQFVSSAKIDKTIELLQTIRANHPGEKTLVFSLWTSFLDLLEISIHDQGFRYTRYDGSMQPKDRDAAVTAFQEKPEIQVMLVSLMAGNAGLNLTAATRVVVLEPFWNPFVEDQAIDRAHRIGQRRPVTVHRVLIAGTVEDRIQELQEKKRRLVGAALSEEGAQSTSRLSARELMGLFGVR